jgi:hypothetical protein
MPLFEFSHKGKGFHFTDNYSLQRFDYKEHVPQELPGLSDIDVSHLTLENWALVADNPPESYHFEIILLLIALRIYAQSSAFIKWRFCIEDPTHNALIGDYGRLRKLSVTSCRSIEESGLCSVRDGFVRLLEMNQVSDRTKNALYFIWRGLYSRNHIDIYIFLVCAIEALFSSEDSEDVTRILIKRTQRFLSGTKGFGGDQIKRIYKIRSDMVHGRIPFTEKNSEQAKKNIEKVAKLERLVLTCMEKMLDEKIYLQYKDTDLKEKYLNDLMNAHL